MAPQPGTAHRDAADAGSVKTVTDETFDADVLSGPRPVIVEYWAQYV